MFFRNKVLMFSTALAVLVTFGWLASGGRLWVELRDAAQDPGRFLARMANDARLALTPAERQQLREAAERARVARASTPAPARAPAMPPVREASADMQAVAAALEAIDARAQATAEELVAEAGRQEERLQAVHQRVLADFAQVETRLLDSGLPDVILGRHNEAVAHYMAGVRGVFDDLRAAREGHDPLRVRASLRSAVAQLRQSHSERPHQRLNPGRLPFRLPKLPRGGEPETMPDTEAPALATRMAKLTPPMPEDVAATEDVQLTPEIRALAASLGNNPIRIHEWVRSNIQYVPTYGSVQGSQLTYISRRGNAFDTSSLLVALLRSAGVSARYVTGRIKVTAAEAQNWVGGAATPKVAQQLLGQGGVPTVGLVSGGTVTHLLVDHVWVEAFVDNIPSRGAVHHQGDTWVPMDAAFKQHTFQAKSGFFEAMPLSAVMQPGDRYFDVDESLGQITNVNDELLDQRLATWAEQSDEYLRTHGIQGTMEGLLGGRTVIAETHSVLAGSLPYEVLVRNAAVSALPSSLRHSVTVTGFGSEYDRATGSPSFSTRLGLPALNIRRLSLQFEPATEADAQTLEDARSSNAASLPVYLVKVVPVLKVDGVEAARGAAVQMGSTYAFDVVLGGPDGPETVPYDVVAGDEIVIGVTGNGVTREAVEARFASNPVDNAPEYFHQVQLHYWMECDHLAEITARARGVHQLRLPSVGVFSSPLTVSYFWGSPRTGVYQGRSMDVKRSFMGAAGADPAQVVAYMKQAGLGGSYLEGAVFDQLDNKPAPQMRGISSVHLISAATAQGIPVYHLTRANQAAVMPRLALSSQVESDISTALSQGKTVLVPERNVDMGSWVGVGYIITDETTGAGAYMISGGLAGGGLIECLRELVPRFEVVLQVLLFLIIAILLILILIGILGSGGILAPAGAAAAAFLLFMLGARSFGPMGGPPLEA